MVAEEAAHLADDAAVARTVEALAQRNVTAWVADSHQEALEKLKELVPAGSEMMLSTSETLATIGYVDHVRSSGLYRDLRADIDAQSDPAKRADLQRRGVVVDYIVGSVHAIAETGEVVIASATGSQLGPYAFSARHVVWVAGTQKIVPTFAEALTRVRGYALERHHQWTLSMGRGESPMGKLLIFENERGPGRVSMILIKDRVGW